MPSSTPLMTDEQRDLMVNLHISDQQTRGRPMLPPHEMTAARAWLMEVLADPDKLHEHIALLAELYRGAFRPPPRTTVFGHCELLAEQHANAVVERGPDALPDAELARLLLNPFALTDLADLIRDALPDWWMEPLAVAGRALIQRHDLVVPPPPELEDANPSSRPPARLRQRERDMQRRQGLGMLAGEGDALVIVFPDESLPLKRRMAEQMYGDPAREFTLTLYRRGPAAEGTCIVELEAAPAPIKDNLTLTVDINGHARTFTLAVPPSVRLDPEADVPERVLARADQPLPESVFPLRGEINWRDVSSLTLRCRQSAFGLPDRSY